MALSRPTLPIMPTRMHRDVSVLHARDATNDSKTTIQFTSLNNLIVLSHQLPQIFFIRFMTITIKMLNVALRRRYTSR